MSSNSDKILRGQVIDPIGEPVPGASVELYPYRAGPDSTPLTVNQTDENGSFQFQSLEEEATREEYIIEPNQSVLIVQYGDWFFTQTGDFEPLLDEELSLTIQDQLLFGPEIAEDDSFEHGKLSIVLGWRSIGDDHQTVFLEATHLNDSPGLEELYEVTGGGAAFSRGECSLSVPRSHARINFGDHSTFQAASVGPVQVLGTDLLSPEIEDWHPFRTGLPLFPIDTPQPYEILSSSQLEEAEELARVEEGLSMIAGGIPKAGTALAVMEAIGFAFGEEPWDKEASVGDLHIGFADPTDPNQVTDVADPNTHTNAFLSWEHESRVTNAGTVTMMFPLEFREAVDTTGVTVRAEWRQLNSHVTFGERFTLSSVTEPLAQTEPTGAGDDPEDVDGEEVETAGDDEDDVPDIADEVPGFGVGGALAGVGGAAYLLRRHVEDDANSE